MFDVPADPPSDAFVMCARSAAPHIDNKIGASQLPWRHGPFSAWYKTNFKPPFVEHFSFRLGNQLFFVLVEDVDGRAPWPGTLEGLLRIADGQKGYACIMPMRCRIGERFVEWIPETAGWGLLDANTGKSIDPLSLVTTEPIEMTDWEVHDIAV